MSNASLKEQLEAMAGQLGNKKNDHPRKKVMQPEKPTKLKPRWLEYAHYGIELLKTFFPASFVSGPNIKPLKKGIKQDLVQRLSTMTIVTDDKACMVKSLAYYVNTTAYHRAVREGVMRVDLDGNEVAAVTKEEAEYSNERFQLKQQAKLNNKNNIKITPSLSSVSER